MFPSEGSTLQLWDDVDGDSQKWAVVDMTPAPRRLLLESSRQKGSC